MSNVGKIARHTHKIFAPQSPMRNILPHREHFAVVDAVWHSHKWRLCRFCTMTKTNWCPHCNLAAHIGSISAISPVPPIHKVLIYLGRLVGKTSLWLYTRNEKILVIVCIRRHTKNIAIIAIFAVAHIAVLHVLCRNTQIARHKKCQAERK